MERAAIMNSDDSSHDRAKAAAAVLDGRARTLLDVQRQRFGVHDIEAAARLQGRSLDRRYRLLERIGGGGFGHVYQAEQVALSRTVAVKVFGPLVDANNALARQFHDEAFASSRLLHPNVVTTFDYGQTEDGFLFIVMEHVPGRTLAELIQQEGRLTVERATHLVLQILNALQEVHAAGVIHADLKSDNVMVKALHSAGEWVKVIDFSIARLLRGASPQGPLWTEDCEGCIAGTPEYMAPEVITGEAPTEKADIYALGVVLYEMITGTVPFTGATGLEIMMQHLQTPVPRPTEAFSDLELSVPLEDVILRALDKDPDRRFADMSEFRSALRAATAEFASPGVVIHLDDDRPHSERIAADEARQARERIAATIERGKSSFAGGKTDTALAELRQAVLQAIQAGDAGLTIEAYLALAGILTQLGAVEGAIAELREAVSLLDSTHSGPAGIWKVYMMLARLYEREGKDGAASVMAHDALEHARRVSSDSGKEDAVVFILRLQQRRRKQ